MIDCQTKTHTHTHAQMVVYPPVLWVWVVEAVPLVRKPVAINAIRKLPPF